MIRIRHSDHGPEQFQKLVVCLSDYFIEIRLQLFELSCSMIHTHKERHRQAEWVREREGGRRYSSQNLVRYAYQYQSARSSLFFAFTRRRQRCFPSVNFVSRDLCLVIKARSLIMPLDELCVQEPIIRIRCCRHSTTLFSSSSSSCLSATQRHRERHSCSSSCPFRPDLKCVSHLFFSSPAVHRVFIMPSNCIPGSFGLFCWWALRSSIYFQIQANKWFGIALLSRLSIQCMQNAILLYQFYPSVCLSNARTMSKRMDISSYFSNDLVGASFQFSEPCRHYKIPRGTPSARAINVRGWKR